MLTQAKKEKSNIPTWQNLQYIEQHQVKNAAIIPAGNPVPSEAAVWCQQDLYSKLHEISSALGF